MSLQLQGYESNSKGESPGRTRRWNVLPLDSPGRKASRAATSKMVARSRARSGAAVGEHTHTGDEEVYHIIPEGIFIEDGVQVKVGPGDTAVTLDGHSHFSIINTGDEPLVFLAVIAE